jgi:preprotein translocase subunit SecA
MIDEMNTRITGILMRAQIPDTQEEVHEATPEQHSQRYVEQKDDIEAEQERAARQAQRAARNQDTREGAQVNHVPYRAEKMPRPNDPCPCGSGKKFKNCHGRNLF